jgi:predicted Zn-dependent peptidase
VVNNSLAATYHQGSSANAFQEIIVQLYHHPFSEEEIETRKRLIASEKTNDILAKECTTLIWT